MDHIVERMQSHMKDDSRLMNIMMIRGHSSAAKWGLSHIAPGKSYRALDVGCGDGANLVRLLALCPEGSVTGIDRSEICVKKSKKALGAAGNGEMCRVMQADVSALPFEESSFDLVTAFETIYFWQELEQAFRQIKRVLKPGGQFLICNEADGQCTEKTSGITVYGACRLKRFLSNVGFSDINIAHETEKHWLCMTAKKPCTEAEQ